MVLQYPKILLATNNQGKLTELQLLLDRSGITVITPKELNIELEVAEDGATYAQNAQKKAQAFAQAANLPTLADDSGLEVSALGGLPGIASARWVSGSDQDRVLALLAKLEKESDRSAKFVSHLCLHDSQTNQSHYWTGSVDGTIALEPRGSTGFGYDPVFIPNGYQKTFSELEIAIKNTISHRAKAFGAFVKSLLHSESESV